MVAYTHELPTGRTITQGDTVTLTRTGSAYVFQYADVVERGFLDSGQPRLVCENARYGHSAELHPGEVS